MIILAALAEQGSTGAVVSGSTITALLVTLGFFLKNNSPLNPAWIPIVVLVLGWTAYIAATWPISVDSVIVGLQVALAAVGVQSGAKHFRAGIKDPTLRKAPPESPTPDQPPTP